MGIHRRRPTAGRCPGWLPHDGGDLPLSRLGEANAEQVAPRRWGSTGPHWIPEPRPWGCPTLVGIYREGLVPPYPLTGLPHTGGDLPVPPQRGHRQHVVAPRRWGSTRSRGGRPRRGPGCPTQVGFYLPGTLFCRTRPRLPHAGGDIPPTRTQTSPAKKSDSPQLREPTHVRPVLTPIRVHPAAAGGARKTFSASAITCHDSTAPRGSPETEIHAAESGKERPAATGIGQRTTTSRRAKPERPDAAGNGHIPTG